ncbi:DNA-binding transcriptional regulator, AcrR family [Mesobacillus persicus]|uniref:DNA-binding transcriptional regulator, AcrR family n=1 Tax=Mesobacillus persicus TaxID=930146 RepID=A0A1H8IZS7_9BACI|nr:TetR/AcrR family transcriptional regulator [Mesobacillus persicus]SEN73546.1 DNA-binding transcriptional regulator, AcrR family [Mesobacillus persicus]
MSPKVSKEHLKQRRAKILEAARAVFIEHGYERATMKHVMDAAGVSRGGLYQYFSNKEELYEAILEERLSSEYANIQNVLNMSEGSYWKLLLKSIFGDDMEPNDEMDEMAPSNLEFFITGRLDERRRKYGQERYQLGIKVYQDVIRAGQESGEFSSKYSSDILARSIVAFIDGLALEYAILPNEDVKLKEQSNMFIEYLRMALGVEG